ncbi:MAG: hypothetical protein R2710_19855 [Acidimicrobiales bacterium]
MLRRTARLVFAPAAWVFPGGRVDPEDHHDDFDTMFTGLSDAEATTILDVVPSGGSRGGSPPVVKRSRRRACSSPPTGPTSTWSRCGAGYERTNRFADLVLEHGITPDASGIEEVARFITPLGSPRRFDARFFVAHAPADQVPEHDDGEIVAWSDLPRRRSNGGVQVNSR